MIWEPITRRGIAFSELEKLQNQLAEKVRTEKFGFLLFSEPAPTLTRGRHTDDGGLISVPPEMAVARVSRGGQWTYHGPGQVLVYPVVSLTKLGLTGKSVRSFLNSFRGATLSWLRDSLQVPAESDDEPFGIYVGESKLASFGIAIERGVIHHGMALYLTDQNPGFRTIHPCGVPGQKSAYLQEFQPQLTWEATVAGLFEALKNGLKLG